jgi:hypothetical protein
MLFQKIESVFLYVCSACWLLLGVFLSYLFLTSVRLSIVQPIYQIICYLMTAVMYPLAPVNFIVRLIAFGFAIAILESAD